MERSLRNVPKLARGFGVPQIVTRCTTKVSIPRPPFAQLAYIWGKKKKERKEMTRSDCKVLQGRRTKTRAVPDQAEQPYEHLFRRTRG